ncbi:MAG: J domain-containing protein [Candidatus Protochlamydia sp.]|nr:J domain-containing protein [Candidatus Protochlamydia sp.]
MPLEQLSNWACAQPADGKRYLWVMDVNTKRISYRERDTYSYFQRSETGRLETIFESMKEELNPSTQFTTIEQYRALISLKKRVDNKYQSYLYAHNFIYKLIFAACLDANYKALQEKIDAILFSSLPSLNVSILSVDEINELKEYVSVKIPNTHPPRPAVLNLDWASLTTQQFSAAVALARFSNNALTLDNLTKEKIRIIFELSIKSLNDFSSAEIDRNFSKLEFQFPDPGSAYSPTRLELNQVSPQIVAKNIATFNLVDLKKLRPEIVQALDISSLSTLQLIHLPYNHLSDDQFQRIDLSLFSQSDIAEMLASFSPYNRFYGFLSKSLHEMLSAESFIAKLTPQTIAANLDKIETKYYKHLTNLQIQEINYFTLNNAQKKAIPRNQRHLFFSNLNIADNLSRIHLKDLKYLNRNQVSSLDIDRLTVAQLIHLPLEHISNAQFLKIDLSNYTRASIAEILAWEDPSERRFSFIFFRNTSSILKKLSPQTVAANLERIETKYYSSLTDQQLNEIDYLTLNESQKSAFNNFNFFKMRNPPQKFNYSSSNFFSDSSSSDDEDDTLNCYFKCFDCALAEVLKVNKAHSNEIYEKLRLKILNNKNIKQNAKLIFVDDVHSFDSTDLSQEYKKIARVIHPDKNIQRNDEATQIFNLVNEAYNLLK